MATPSTPRDDNKSAKCKKVDSATDTEDLVTTEDEVSMLSSINNKLDTLMALHTEIKEIQTSLNFAYEKIDRLESENKSLKVTVDLLTKKTDTITKENKKINEAVLDIQSRSMRDNLIFSGIPENPTSDHPEALLKDFLISKLKLPPDTVDNITFHRVHRLGSPKNKRPRPIIAKLEHNNIKISSKVKEESSKVLTTG